MKKYNFLTVCLLFIIQAYSVTYTVTNTNDAGAGSFRQAITDANTVYVGTKQINFNIPTSDIGYNPAEGTWTFHPATPYPYIMTGYVIIDGTSQGNTNPDGPEIIINGNGSLDHAFLLVSPNNTVKGIAVCGCLYGIIVYNSTAANNTITQCYIGTNYNGTVAVPNGYGIAVNHAATNTQITNNLVSGNTDGGILIASAWSNAIKGNQIGTDRVGTTALANNNGIAFNNAPNNTIGGISAADRNIISGNTNAGLVINSDSSKNNMITGNFIGTDLSGYTRLDNGSGIIVVNSGGNTIGGNSPDKRNVISGNTEAGVTLNGSGTNNNIIIGNYIGTDKTGLQICYNHVGIFVKSNADRNIIGGATAGERNVLSGNSEIGVYIEVCDSNIVSGNYIGPDATGAGALKVGDTLWQANGIELNTVSRYNLIGGYSPEERNIISGNRVYGMIYYGQTSFNPVVGNYIGTDVSGNLPLPNATGICVDAASNHNLIKNNVLSGNVSYGIFIVTTGTYYNEFKGNLLGTNAAGTDTVPNDIGLLLGGGARYNMIGGTSPGDRNIFSGNRYEGIEIADNMTDYNTITGNYIGTDITGQNALPNPVGIGIATNPSNNTISENVISGNLRMGMILYEHADSNLVLSNKIGVAADGSTDLGNGGSGIVLAQGASYNKIGLPGQGNTIAYNDSCGIVVADNDTRFNSFTQNSIHNNNLPGIEIFPPGPNANDAGDIDNGPNDMANYPIIIFATYNSLLTVSGTLDNQNPASSVVDIFEVADIDPMGHGEANTYLCSATPDAGGNWNVNYTGPFYETTLTALATDALGNTSEFALNAAITMVGIDDTKNSTTWVGNNYPNPLSNKTIISYILPENKNAFIEIKDINNKLMATIPLKAGKNQAEIDTSCWAAGVYHYTFLIDKNIVETRKMILIK